VIIVAYRLTGSQPAAVVTRVLAVAVAGLMVGHDTPRFTTGARRSPC
jgi:hypothetical protein